MLPALRDSAASFVPVILNALLLLANQLGAIRPDNEAPSQPRRFNLADATVDDPLAAKSNNQPRLANRI